MSSHADLVRTLVSVLGGTVTTYSAVRLATSWNPRDMRLRRPASLSLRSSDLTCALAGLGMVVLATGLGDALAPATGMLVYLLLGAWLAMPLVRSGLVCRLEPPSASRPSQNGPAGGYVLHHIALCVGMIYLFATEHPGPGGLTGAEPFAPTGATSQAGLPGPAMSAGTSVSWLLALYFLTAATSLGFRIVDPAVRVTLRTATPGASPEHLDCPRLPAKLLRSPAGNCASEVTVSVGLALTLLSAG